MDARRKVLFSGILTHDDDRLAPLVSLKKGLLPRSNYPGQQDEEDAIGPGERWPFHLTPEDDELLS